MKGLAALTVIAAVQTHAAGEGMVAGFASGVRPSGGNIGIVFPDHYGRIDLGSIARNRPDQLARPSPGSWCPWR